MIVLKAKCYQIILETSNKVSNMTEKLKQRKIVLISLLKSKGINKKTLFAKILKGNKRSLNMIYQRYIRHARIDYNKFFEKLIKDTLFRKRLLLVQKIELISTTLNDILDKHYSNNKSNTLFQEIIDYLLYLLLKSNNTHLSFDLYTHVKQNYKLESKINVVNATRKAGKYTLEQLKLVNELIDHIDYINFIRNDITRLQRLRMKINLNTYTMNYINDVEHFTIENKELREIYDRLTMNGNKIENKLLYNQLTNLKQELRETLYTINYGINYSDKASSKDPNNLTQVLSSAILPFSESGALEITDKQFNHLNINTIYFGKSNIKAINKFKNNKQIKVISEGVNPYNQNKYNKSYFIHYQYISTKQQQKSFKVLMRKLKQSCINNAKHDKYDNFKHFIRCTYNFPYYNQTINFKAFKQYFNDNINTSLNVKYSYLYPYAIKQSSRQKKKFLSFLSWDNNVFKGFLMRSKIDRNLSNIIYNLDLNRKITLHYKATNLSNTHRVHRLFLKDIITEIRKNYLKRFNAFLYDLIKDNNNRIYLFELYEIKALVNQITRLQQYYDSFKAKRTLKAIKTKHLIQRLKTLIPLRKQDLDVLKWRNCTIENNLKNLKTNNVLIQSILDANFEDYVRKTIIRKIDTSRLPKELILMACNNLKPIYIDYMGTSQVYVKELTTELSKFDEILDLNDNYKIENIDKITSIDIISFFKAIVKFDRYLKLDDLYNVILNSNINNNKQKNKLIDFIYKEKLILNN